MSQNHPARHEVSEWNPETAQARLTAAECPLLALHRIAHVGWAETPTPFRVVRPQPSGSYVLVSLAGEGRMLLDGRWQRCLPGMACLAPPRILNAFSAVPGQRWHFFWVRYFEPVGQPSVVSARSPVQAPCDPALLSSAIRGLVAERAGAAEPRLLHHWVELIHAEAQRLAQPWQTNERLAQVWLRVGENLAAPWSAEELARLTHCSTEHLRRLCRRELGRTPMQQVTYMRMQHAAELLRTTGDKLMSIAAAVGYNNAFVLSKLFKKWIGASPSEYRVGGVER